MMIATIQFSVLKHTLRFSFAYGRFSYGGRPKTIQLNEESMLSPVAYGLLLATTILAVVILILAFEKFWIKIKDNLAGSKEYQRII